MTPEMALRATLNRTEWKRMIPVWSTVRLTMTKQNVGDVKLITAEHECRNKR